MATINYLGVINDKVIVSYQPYYSQLIYRAAPHKLWVSAKKIEPTEINQ